MFRLLLPLTALLASVALLLAGSGLLSTLLAVRGGLEGFDSRTLGLIMSGYFVGFFLGTFVAPALVRRVGHIRAFSIFTASAAVATLLHPILESAPSWFVLRIATGVAMVGLVTVIESWLGSHAPPERRSGVFGVYMMVSLLAMAAGQLLLGVQPPGSFVLFSVVAVLISLAALPVALTQLAQPQVTAAPRADPRMIVRVAPTAAAGALLSGLAMGAFWGLGALFAAGKGLDRSQIGALMALTVLGGAAFQLPIGRLSDRQDRRSMLTAVSALAAAVAAGIALFDAPTPMMLLTGFFIYGGLAFSLYPLCAAHLFDRLPPDALLSGCSALLLVHGVGAAIGPVIAGVAMFHFGPDALPAMFAVALAPLALVAGGRRLLRANQDPHRGRFQPMFRTTPTILALLPAMRAHRRGDES